MKQRLIISKSICLICLSFIMLCLHVYVCADDDLFLMEVTTGFNNVLKWGRFFPVSVSVQNNGNKCEGKLVVEIIKGNTYGTDIFTVKHSQGIKLPSGAKKTYSFIVESWNFTYPLTVKLIISGKVVVLKEIDVLPYVTTKRIILCLSNTPFLTFLSYSGSTGYPVQMIYPSVSELPVFSSGYDMVDMIVVYDKIIQQLSDARLAAMEKWVSSGGIMVISGKQLKGPLQKLISAEITGYTQKTNLPSLVNTYGYEFPPNTGFPLMIIIPGEGTHLMEDRDQGTDSGLYEILLSDYDIPLVIRKTLDCGYIYLCSFDFGISPFTEWQGRFKFWDDKLGPVKDNSQTGGIYKEEGFEDESFHAYLMNKKKSTDIRYIFLYIFISLYTFVILLVVFLKYENPAFKKNGLSKWHLLLFVSVLFGVCGWFVFDTIIYAGNFFYTDITVISHNSGEIHAAVEHHIGLFSFRDTTYSLNYPYDVYNIRVLYPDDTKNTAFSMEIESLTTIKEVKPGKWNSLQIDAAGKIRFPLHGSLSTGRNDDSFVVTNNTDFTIMEAMLVREDTLYSIGAIPAGMNKQWTFTRNNRRDMTELYGMGSPAKKAAIDTYLIPLLKESDASLHAYIIGWIGDYPGYPSFLKKAQTYEEICLVIAEIPVVYNMNGSNSLSMLPYSGVRESGGEQAW